MTERKWVPVAPINRKENATRDLEKVLRQTLDVFGGKVLHVAKDGKIDVEFPNLHEAGTYVTWQVLSDSVVALRVANPHKPYMCKAIVTIQS